MQRRSRQTGLLYDLLRPGWEDVTVEESAAGGFPAEKLALIGDTYEKELKWVMEGSILEDRDRAIKMVEQLT